MQLLTPSGYRDVADCKVGDAVVAFDPVTGEVQHNLIEEIEFVSRPEWQPYAGLRFGKWKGRQDDWFKQQREAQDSFCWYRINGRHVLFAEQSVWADDNVTHAKLLTVGQTIYLDDDRPELVESVERIADGLDTWVRFRISGDHSYVLDGLTLHNASRFWVGGTANWDASTTTNWSGSNGGAGGASVPTSSDDVSFTSLSNATAYTVTVTATANCRDMTWALPGTSGVPTLAGSSALNIFGSLTNIATMLWSATSTVSFSATSGAKTITSAGVTYGSGQINFNGNGSTYTLQDAFALSSNGAQFTFLNGSSFAGNGQTISVGTWITSGASAKTINITNCTVNVYTTSGNQVVDMTQGTVTLTSTGSTFNVTGTGGAGRTLALSSYTYGTFNITGAGNWTLSGGPTCAAFSYTSTTAKTDSLALGGNLTVTGTYTLAGNSSVNRAFVLSSVLGTQRTISAGTIVGTNVDFQDISGTGAATWAYNSGSNSSWGDALGNAGLTCNPSVSQTYAGGTNNWSTAAAWTSRVPLPQDDVVVNTTTAGTLTADMPRLGRNIDFTSFTRTYSQSSTNPSIFGNLTLAAGMTISMGAGQFFLYGRGAQTITSNGKSLSTAVTFNAFGGSYTLQDAAAFDTLTLNNGTFDANLYAVSINNIASTVSNTRVLNLGTNTWSVANVSGTPWNLSGAGLTVNKGSSTIKFTGNISTTATFNGLGAIYNNLWWSNTAATGTLIITGANTFASIKNDPTTARTIQLPHGVTQTILPGGFQLAGGAGQALTLNSDLAGSAATISCSGGDCQSVYMTIKDSTATGGANFRDVHGIGGGGSDGNVSGNTGWTFGNVSVTNAATLAATAAETGSPAKNAKPSVSLLCATIAQGIVVKAAKGTGALTSAALAAGSLVSGKRVSASLTGAAAETGSLVRGLRSSASFIGAAAETGSAARNLKPAAGLAAASGLSGTPRRSTRPAASLATGAAQAGNVAVGRPVTGSLAARGAQSGIVTRGARGSGALSSGAANTARVSARNIKPAAAFLVGASMATALRRLTSAAALLAGCAALTDDGDVIHLAVKLVGHAESPVTLVGHAQSPINVVGGP